MSIKSLASAIPRFCSTIDVAAKFPKLVTESINMDEADSPVSAYSTIIDQSIIDATSEIITALLPIYTSTTNLEATAPWVGIIVSNKQNDTPSSRLLACAAGTGATTETFTLTFDSSTGYTVTGQLSGIVGTGSTSADFTSTGGDLLIAAGTNSGLFSGSFASGDKIFISVNKWNRTISSICTYKACADALRSIFFSSSINDETNLVEKMSNHAKRILDRLQRPYDPDGYSLSTLPSRDFSEIQLGSWNPSDDNAIVDQFGSFDADSLQTDRLENYSRS